MFRHAAVISKIRGSIQRINASQYNVLIVIISPSVCMCLYVCHKSSFVENKDCAAARVLNNI